MATVTHKGNPVHTNGEVPTAGSSAPDWTLVDTGLKEIHRDASVRTVLNIFPSVDTGVCATSVRRFNELASSLPDTIVVCASADLPFALSRFCGAEGLSKVQPASAFRSSFPEDYGVRLVDGALAGLCARAVVVVDRDGTVLHSELVPEIGNEPDYQAVLDVLN